MQAEASPRAPLEAQLLAGIPPTITTPEEARALAALISDYIPAKAQAGALSLPRQLSDYDSAKASGASNSVVFANSVVMTYQTALSDFRWALARSTRAPVSHAAVAPSTAETSVGPGLKSGRQPSPSPSPALDQTTGVWTRRLRLPWLRRGEHLLPYVQSMLVQKNIVPLTIGDGLSAIALATVIRCEFAVGPRPHDLLVFEAQMHELLRQELARSRAQGDEAEYARIEQELLSFYSSVLAQTRAELESPDSRWARTSREEWEMYRAESERRGAVTGGPDVEGAPMPAHAVDDLSLEAGIAVKVPISSIKVSSSRQVGDVTGLVESMRELGQLQPIVVTPNGELIAGMHRLRAAQVLGWTEIQVIVLDLDGAKKQLAVLDENLVRRQLSALEYAEALAERKQLYESLHPETQQHRRGGAAKAAKGATALSAVADSFAVDTAARIGLSPRTIREYTQVTSMAQDVRDALRSTDAKNKVKELVAVARLPIPEQKTVAAALAKGGAKNVKEAVGMVRTPATAATAVPYAVTQAPRIRKQVADIRRVSAEVEAALKEWKATDPTGMAPLIAQWTNIAASTSGACAVANQVEIPATACRCGGSRKCSECGGRGWTKDK